MSGSAAATGCLTRSNFLHEAIIKKTGALLPVFFISLKQHVKKMRFSTIVCEPGS